MNLFDFRKCSKNSKVFWCFSCFCKGNCYFWYRRIRIQCIKLYISTWVKDNFRPQKSKKIDPPKIENLGEYFWDFWAPNAPLHFGIPLGPKSMFMVILFVLWLFRWHLLSKTGPERRAPGGRTNQSSPIFSHFWGPAGPNTPPRSFWTALG